MASRLYLSWQNPLAVDNGHWVALGTGILIMEMVLVHSGVLMASGAGMKPGPGSGRYMSRETSMIMLIVFYTLFGVAIAAGFKVGMELFWSFFSIMFSRWAGLLADACAAKDQQFGRSLLSVLLFTVSVAPALVVKFPVGALTPAMLKQVGAGPGAQQALVAGMIYFALSGVAEVTGPFWRRPKVQNFVKNILFLPVFLTIILAIARMALGGFSSFSK